MYIDFTYCDLIFLLNILFTVLLCERRCRTSRLTVLDDTSVAGTLAYLKRTYKSRVQIWIDAEVGSEACQVRNRAEAQNGN